jgi:hypothetical protein
MKFQSKVFGFLLIPSLMMATLASGAWVEVEHGSSPSAARSGRPAGCHEHGGRNSSNFPHPQSSPPAPANYQCCLTGHGAAVVWVSDSEQPSSLPTRVALSIEPARVVSARGDLEVSTLLSNDPPGMTPLRV